jgi:hypothetical protein
MEGQEATFLACAFWRTSESLWHCFVTLTLLMLKVAIRTVVLHKFDGGQLSWDHALRSWTIGSEEECADRAPR